MSVFDVREDNDIVEAIRFGSPYTGYYRAVILEQYSGKITINDDGSQVVILDSKEHALNLKKALDKAIELGWLK